jgi:transcriptional regulator with XRE-family HTH domain
VKVSAAKNGAARAIGRLSGAGKQVRHARLQRGITLRDFAGRLGVSPSLVSLIERDRVMPSVSTLYSIVTELGLSMDELFAQTETADKAQMNRRKAGESESLDLAAPAAVSVTGSNSPVLRPEMRPRINLANGVRWERLTPQPDSHVEFLHIIYDVGAESCDKDALMRHEGREYGCVLSGRLGVQLGFENYELGPGESVTFASNQPHRLYCVGKEPMHALWVVVGRNSNG